MTTSRRDARRTPLRDWQRRRSVAWDALSQRTGLSLSTVMRAAAGKPVGAAAALALERETGIAAATFLGSELEPPGHIPAALLVPGATSKVKVTR